MSWKGIFESKAAKEIQDLRKLLTEIDFSGSESEPANKPQSPRVTAEEEIAHHVIHILRKNINYEQLSEARTR